MEGMEINDIEVELGHCQGDWAALNSETLDSGNDDLLGWEYAGSQITDSCGGPWLRRSNIECIGAPSDRD